MYAIGIEDMRKGRISFTLACLFLMKVILPIVVTNKFSDNETMGIASVLNPKRAINAVYEEPPPSPTVEYVNATRKNKTAKEYGDVISSKRDVSFLSLELIADTCRYVNVA